MLRNIYIKVSESISSYNQMSFIYNSIVGMFNSKQQRRPEPKMSNIRLLKPLEQGKKVVAVIVTFVNGSSYDHLFSSMEQKAEEGTQVLVYSCNSNSVSAILNGFNNETDDQTVKDMIGYIRELDSDCVVFNWECCSGYSGEMFQEGKQVVFDFVAQMLQRGYMLMFSDFSLKALIKEWNTKVLGPNPFKKVSEFGGNFKISFNCETLRDCPSAQLQIVGEMASEGYCNVNAMGGTIVYGVNKEHKNQIYDLQVLTVASSLNIQKNYKVEIGTNSGAAGHVLLKYKKGGCILTSMGHWIELMKIDTSEKALFDIAEKEYGMQEAQRMRMEYDVMDAGMKKEYISRNAVQFVQKQAPCTNMARKARSKY